MLLRREWNTSSEDIAKPPFEHLREAGAKACQPPANVVSDKWCESIRCHPELVEGSASVAECRDSSTSLRMTMLFELFLRNYRTAH